MIGILALALAAPVVATAAAVAAANDRMAWRLLQAGALVAAGAWAAIAMGGFRAEIGPFHGRSITAAACGACLLVGVCDRPMAQGSAIATGAGLAAACAGLSATTETSASGLVLGLAAAVLCLAFVAWREREGGAATVLAAGGVVATTVGLIAAHGLTNEWGLVQPGADLAARALVFAGLGAVAVAGVWRAGHADAYLLAPAAAAAVMSAVALAPTAAAAVPLALVAIAAAAARRSALALLVFALAVSLGPGFPSAPALLLGAGAVLAAVWTGPGALALGLPGAVALVTTWIANGGVLAALLGAATIVLAILAATDRTPFQTPSATAAPALLLASWLLVAPGSWTWAGHAVLDAYDRAAGAATAAALVVLVGAALWARGRLLTRSG